VLPGRVLDEVEALAPERSWLDRRCDWGVSANVWHEPTSPARGWKLQISGDGGAEPFGALAGPRWPSLGRHDDSRPFATRSGRRAQLPLVRGFVKEPCDHHGPPRHSAIERLTGKINTLAHDDKTPYRMHGIANQSTGEGKGQSL
jgi:hypothetical protein